MATTIEAWIQTQKNIPEITNFALANELRDAYYKNVSNWNKAYRTARVAVLNAIHTEGENERGKYLHYFQDAILPHIYTKYGQFQVETFIIPLVDSLNLWERRKISSRGQSSASQGSTASSEKKTVS